MSEWTIITNKGFSSDEWEGRPVIEPADILSSKVEIEHIEKSQLKLENDFQVETLKPFLNYLNAISINFPLHDGRGFSLARRLRQLGYQGILRLEGHVVVDHYRHAIQSGFDQIAISSELTKRIPESHWKQQIHASKYSYQAKLRQNGYDKSMNGFQIKTVNNIQNSNLATLAFGNVKVTKVLHWTDQLFSFRVERPKNFRFRSGQFAMIGLPGNNGKPIFRAYSISSPSWDDELEFYSIIIPDGSLTSLLQHISVSDNVILQPKATGTLVLDALRPGKRLFMFASGTGIAPFASLIRDPETYEKFEKIIITHGCREIKDLNYGKSIVDAIGKDPLIGEFAADKLFYCPTVTREEFHTKGRITDLLETGQFFQNFHLAAFSPDTDRAMICGSIEFNDNIKTILGDVGLNEGSNNHPAEFVQEKAFVGYSNKDISGPSGLF